MACEICGRSNCTRSFHSLEEQESFDTIADAVKYRMREYLIAKINRLNDWSSDENVYLVDLSEVIDIINSY